MFTRDQAIVARDNMIESQIRPNRVYDPGVLQAMLDLPREAFVPDVLKAVAYTDEALKVGPGRYLPEPLVTARLLEAAEIREGSKVLIVGAATGYSTALSVMIGAETVAVECDEALTSQAKSALQATGCENALWTSGPLQDGYRDGAPYDAIVIDGGVVVMPPALLDQLKPQGRLVAIIKGAGQASHITVFERVGSTISSRVIFDNIAPTLPGFEARPAFAFS